MSAVSSEGAGLAGGLEGWAYSADATSMEARQLAEEHVLGLDTTLSPTSSVFFLGTTDVVTPDAEATASASNVCVPVAAATDSGASCSSSI